MENDKKECGCDVHDYCSQHAPKENKEECIACGIKHDPKKTSCYDQMNLAPQTPDSDTKYDFLLNMGVPKFWHNEVVKYIKSEVSLAHSLGRREVTEKVSKFIDTNRDKIEKNRYVLDELKSLLEQ